jgi:hypothetical protein
MPRGIKTRNPAVTKIAQAWVSASFEDKCSFVGSFVGEVESVMNYVFNFQGYDGLSPNDGTLDEETLNKAAERASEKAAAPVKQKLISRPSGPYAFKPQGEVIFPEIELALSHGLTVSEVARRIGVAYNTVNRWRHGKTRPNADSLAKISALGTEDWTDRIGII